MECLRRSVDRTRSGAKATEFHPDVVVLDIAMPEMNGLEAARQIRRAVPTARILVLTVHQIDQLAQEFIDAGFVVIC